MRQGCLWDSEVPLPSARPKASLHKQAIERLVLEIKAREGLVGWLHDGIALCDLVKLLACGEPSSIEIEKAIPIGRRRYVPDLTVRCSRTGRIQLVIEVWHSHAVSARKKAAFAAAGINWVEVRSYQTMSRFRKCPLPVLDWGGPELPQAPEQTTIENMFLTNCPFGWWTTLWEEPCQA